MAGITVLVVEDEALIRMSIVARLEAEGFDVLEAVNADQAIAILERKPDIRMLFTDVDMPGSMDGLKLSAFVRDRWPPVKIIVTSGKVAIENSALPEGSIFISKPYHEDRIVASIRTMLTD